LVNKTCAWLESFLHPILDRIIHYSGEFVGGGIMQEKQGQGLAGKIVFVTGGSRGIGAGVVRRFAEEGATVVFTYSSSEERAQTLAAEVNATAIRADSGSAEDIRRAIAAAVEQCGLLDCFVNNAGVLIGGLITDYRLEDLDRMLSVNVRAAVLGIQRAAQSMNDGGRILTIGSITAIRTGFPGSSIYSMTKSALAGLVRGAAIDLAPRNITVNNIQPGPTATDMNPADGPHVGMLTKLIPLRRFGKDTEIASLAAYLASDEAAFITGASFTIDGGYVA
jgi:3-oxoacyl-[acyl-carrier protein] reductase